MHSNIGSALRDCDTWNRRSSHTQTVSKRPIAVSKETYYNEIKIVIPGIAVRVTLKPPVHLLDSHKP